MKAKHLQTKTLLTVFFNFFILPIFFTLVFLKNSNASSPYLEKRESSLQKSLDFKSGTNPDLIFYAKIRLFEAFALSEFKSNLNSIEFEDLQLQVLQTNTFNFFKIELKSCFDQLKKDSKNLKSPSDHIPLCLVNPMLNTLEFFFENFNKFIKQEIIPKFYEDPNVLENNKFINYASLNHRFDDLQFCFAKQKNFLNEIWTQNPTSFNLNQFLNEIFLGPRSCVNIYLFDLLNIVTSHFSRQLILPEQLKNENDLRNSIQTSIQILIQFLTKSSPVPYTPDRAEETIASTKTTTAQPGEKPALQLEFEQTTQQPESKPKPVLPVSNEENCINLDLNNKITKLSLSEICSFLSDYKTHISNLLFPQSIDAQKYDQHLKEYIEELKNARLFDTFESEAQKSAFKIFLQSKLFKYLIYLHLYSSGTSIETNPHQQYVKFLNLKSDLDLNQFLDSHVISDFFALVFELFMGPQSSQNLGLNLALDSETLNSLNQNLNKIIELVKNFSPFLIHTLNKKHHFENIQTALNSFLVSFAKNSKASDLKAKQNLFIIKFLGTQDSEKPTSPMEVIFEEFFHSLTLPAIKSIFDSLYKKELSDFLQQNEITELDNQNTLHTNFDQNILAKLNYRITQIEVFFHKKEIRNLYKTHEFNELYDSFKEVLINSLTKATFDLSQNDYNPIINRLLNYFTQELTNDLNSPSLVTNLYINFLAEIIIQSEIYHRLSQNPTNWFQRRLIGNDDFKWSVLKSTPEGQLAFENFRKFFAQSMFEEFKNFKVKDLNLIDPDHNLWSLYKGVQASTLSEEFENSLIAAFCARIPFSSHEDFCSGKIKKGDKYLSVFDERILNFD